MKLYDNAFSPYAFKVRAALFERGIAFEKHEIRTQADRATLLALNPRGEVPALVDGDTVICDSKVICGWSDSRRVGECSTIRNACCERPSSPAPSPTRWPSSP